MASTEACTVHISVYPALTIYHAVLAMFFDIAIYLHQLLHNNHSFPLRIVETCNYMSYMELVVWLLMDDMNLYVPTYTLT